jgi:nitroreductase
LTDKEELMIEGSEVRKADYPVDELFLNRWSPRAMSGEGVSEEELMTLFEAARWAPSSYNNQPWRILYARRDTEHWPVFLGLLVEGNRAWAKDAAALLLFVSKETFDFNGQPYPTHSFDTGAAWENLSLQATLKGLVTHGMQGFDYERARTELNIPEGFRVEAIAAVGRPGDPASLPEQMREMEKPSGRKPLSEITCEGPFRF